MSQENIWGSYVSDKDKALQANDYEGFKFGLNQGLKITKFVYTTQTGSNNTESTPAVEIEISLDIADARPMNVRIYAPNKLYKAGGVEITDTNSEEYKKALIQDVTLKKGLLTHYVKALGATEMDIQNAFNASAPTNFESLAKLYVNLASTRLGNKVDLFAHYQKTLKSGAAKTYLEIPTNLAYGPFIVAHRPGTFEQVADYDVETKQEDGSVKIESIKGGIAYKNAEGMLHPFKRDKKYAETTRAKQQTPETIGGLNPMGQNVNPNGGFGQMAQTNQPAEGTQAQDQDW